FKLRQVLWGAAPAVAAVFCFAGFQYWLSVTGKLPAQYNTKASELLHVLRKPLNLPINIAYYGWSISMYLGLFLSPVLLMTRVPAGPNTPASGLAWLPRRGFPRLGVMLFLAL